MSLPWNVIDENNILLSHREFLSKVRSIKPLYEKPDQIKIVRPSIIPLIIYNILFLTIIVLSFEISYLFSLFLLPLSYPLGIQLSRNVDLKILLIYIILFPILIINMKVGLIIVISILMIFYVYFTRRKSKYVFAFSIISSNLIYELALTDFNFKIVRSDLSLSPYKMYIELLSNNSGVTFHDFITIYAINKGVAGIIIEIEFYLSDTRNEKFEEFLNSHFNSVKSFLLSRLNEKEWVLG